MKIKHTDGTETETNELPDMQAAILEKQHKDFEFYQKLGVHFFSYVQNPDDGGWNLTWNHGDTEEGITKMIQGMVLFVEQASQGKLKVVEADEEEDDSFGEFKDN